jgi:hypothetical protein
LVEIIKKVKNEKQIIFATHNANIVINGDADLIYFLETDDDNRTKVTSLTIENIENRDKLFSLEGGEIAFKKRRERLYK